MKSELFQRIKFINSDASFQKALTLVMDQMMSRLGTVSIPDEVQDCFQQSTELKEEFLRRKALFWFYGTFLECMSGSSNWGKLVKCTDLVSQAKDKDGGPNRVATESDEAFALLMIENNVYKWKKQKAVPDDDANAGADEQEVTIQKQLRQTGTCTGKQVGTANTVGVVTMEWYGSMNCTNWWRTTELASKQKHCRSEYGGDLGGDMQGEQGSNNAGQQ